MTKEDFAAALKDLIEQGRNDGVSKEAIAAVLEEAAHALREGVS